MEPLCIADGNVKWGSCYLEKKKGGNLAILKNSNRITMWYSNSTSRIHSTEVKAGTKEIFVHPCSQQHYSLQLKGGNDPTCLSADEQINKMWYSHITKSIYKFCNKKEWSIVTCKNMDGSQKICIKEANRKE